MAGPEKVNIALSVVIPVRNSEKVLGAQLDALARQVSAPAFEVLVCDNGSTDDTRKVVDSWAGRLPHVRWVDASSRRGCAHARNVGAAGARSDRLLFCDGDDVVDPGWVAAMAAALDRHVVVAGRMDTVLLNPARARASREAPQTEGLQQAGFLPHAGGGNLAICKTVFDAVGGFDPEQRYLEDMEFCWRLQIAGYSLVFEPRALVNIRLRSDTLAIFQQGWNYGTAVGQLEERYAVYDTKQQSRQTGPEPSQRSSLQKIRRLVTDAIRQPNSGGAAFVIWQAGWHIGHRVAGRASSAAAPEVPNGPALLQRRSIRSPIHRAASGGHSARWANEPHQAERESSVADPESA